MSLQARSAVPLLNDTIAALASAPGPAERGIVRVSGPQTTDVVSAIFAPEDSCQWVNARLPGRHPGFLHVSGLHLPLAVEIWLWPTARSYTGQPTAEVHTIGSPPILEAVLQELFEHGARPAQRGEFSLRAFLNGRIDLMQAEAVLGVIDATDQQKLRVALDQLGGGLSRGIASLHEELLLHLADLEAGLDFVEEDIEFVSRDRLINRIDDGCHLLQGLLDQASTRLHTSGRRKVVLGGLPNAGKSTLFNALTGRDTALVSPVSGTTRDYLSAPVDWNGISIELIDTAGWEHANSSGARLIEHAADKLRHDQWQRADLILWCSPAVLSEDDAVLDAQLRSELHASGRSLVHVVTKSDLDGGDIDPGMVSVSAVSSTGLDDLREHAAAMLLSSPGDESMLGTTAARCRDSLQNAAAALERAGAAARSELGDELVSVELRSAIDSLGQIVGTVYTDDILDRIFSRFCIGK